MCNYVSFELGHEPDRSQLTVAGTVTEWSKLAVEERGPHTSKFLKRVHLHVSFFEEYNLCIHRLPAACIASPDLRCVFFVVTCDLFQVAETADFSHNLLLRWSLLDELGGARFRSLLVEVAYMNRLAPSEIRLVLLPLSEVVMGLVHCRHDDERVSNRAGVCR